MDNKDFKYIRNRIREFKKEDLLDECYFFLESRKEVNFPIWSVFLIMKWTYLYAEESYPYKKLERYYFVRLLKWTSELNQEHASSFIKNKKIDRAFLVLNSQQLYLQKSIYNEIFATQIKLFETIKGKYDINKSFQQITGLSITDFLFILKLFWIRIDSATFGNISFYGYFEDYVLELFKEIVGCYKLERFVKTLTLSEENSKKDIESFNKTIKNSELQILETTFLTMFPLQKFKGKLKLVHKRVFKYTANYYIYDLLKKHDDKFTTEFGNRIEKYIELGFKEIGYSYLTEKQLKQKLPPKSKVIDYYLDDLKIFIECKAIELQAYPSINPTDELLYNALKDSILKAYFEQLLTVTNILNPNEENWGIIVTYKELFWGDFHQLYELGKDIYNIDVTSLKPENVFIIDIYTWNAIIQIIKDKKASLLDILKNARKDNLKIETKKQLFSMHLDKYHPMKIDLAYLKDEIDLLDAKNIKDNIS